MSNCIVCGSEFYDEPLMLLDNMPMAAQNMPDKSMLNSDKGIQLKLCQCKGCGLVQFDCTPVYYYKDVIRSGGFSTTMVNLRKKQYTQLIEKYHLEGRKFIEIGCGRGEFLTVLSDFPVKAFGIEHNKDLAAIACQNGLHVFEGFVEDKDSVIVNGPYDAFLSFNFLEHQPDPNGMLQGIYNNLTNDGMGLITVPSWEYILGHDGYYELIRDHIAYYTFDTLRFALEKNGFEVLEHDVINRDTLSVVVKKRKRLNIEGIKNSYAAICNELNDYIDGCKKSNKQVAVWGASHQGFTLASTADLTDKVEYIIDSAPFKQGKYAPASHIPIVSPEWAAHHLVDAIIIMAPGYTNEIASLIKERYGEQIEIAMITGRHLSFFEGNTQ